LEVVDESLIPNVATSQSKVFYHKMYANLASLLTPSLNISGTDLNVLRKGDYCRYLAEFASAEKSKVAVASAHEAHNVCSKSFNLEFNQPSCTDQRSYNYLLL
jgi:14-3-3 protein epsilon